MPQNYGTILPITLPELNDEANIITALSDLYYGTGTLPTTAEALKSRVSVGGYIQKLFSEKANYTDKLSVFASTSSSELKGIISDETGSGSLVFANTPSILTPSISSPVISGTVTISGGTSGQVTLSVPSVSGTTAILFPATTGTVVTTGDSGTVTNTMLAGSIANGKLANSTISGIALGNNLSTLTIGSYLTGTSYNGSSAVTIAADASSTNTASKLVARDSSGNFAAGTITASLSGNASTATKLATARTINGVSFDGSADISITSSLSNALTIGGGLSLSSGTTFDGSAARTLSLTTTGASDGYILKYTAANGPVWASAGEISGTISNAVNATYAQNLASSTLFTIPYQDTFTSPATSKTSFLAPNTTTAKRFLTQTGTGSAGAAPVWSAIIWSDISGLSGTTGTSFALGDHLHTGVYEPVTSAFTGKTYNGLTLTAQTTGFTISGGTTSRTLSVIGSSSATVSGTNTGDQTITLTGDVTGSGTGSFAATLSNTGVTAGTYTKLQVDAKGRVLSASTPTSLVDTGVTLVASDIPNLAASKITSGTFDSARIPTLNQDTTGTAATATNITTSTKVSIQDTGASGTPTKSMVAQIYVQSSQPQNAVAGDLWFW